MAVAALALCVVASGCGGGSKPPPSPGGGATVPPQVLAACEPLMVAAAAAEDAAASKAAAWKSANDVYQARTDGCDAGATDAACAGLSSEACGQRWVQCQTAASRAEGVLFLAALDDAALASSVASTAVAASVSCQENVLGVASAASVSAGGRPGAVASSVRAASPVRAYAFRPLANCPTQYAEMLASLRECDRLQKEAVKDSPETTAWRYWGECLGMCGTVYPEHRTVCSSYDIDSSPHGRCRAWWSPCEQACYEGYLDRLSRAATAASAACAQAARDESGYHHCVACSIVGLEPNCRITPAASSSGDPHLRTWDDVRYDFQAVGEFILARDGADFEVQVRQGPRGHSRLIAVNTAVAFKIGTRKLVYTLGSPPSLTLDGVEQALSGTVTLAAGSFTWAGPYLSVTWAGGHLADVKRFGDHLSISLSLPAGTTSTPIGLLGDHDGDRRNDFRLRDGTVLATLPKEIRYGAFAAAWRITDAESLFTYPAGKGTADYTDLTYPERMVSTSQLSADAFQSARSTCLAAGVTEGGALEDCILDVGLTGDPSFVSDALSLPASPTACVPDCTADPCGGSDGCGGLCPVTASCTTCTGAAAAASIVVNGGFEEPVVRAGTYSLLTVGASIPGWSVVGAPGDVAIVSSTYAWNGVVFVPPEGAQLMDLTGRSKTATGISQAMPTTPGTAYCLTFLVGNVPTTLAASGSSTVNVLIDGAQVRQVTNADTTAAGITWKQFSVPFTAATSSTVVSFMNGDGADDDANLLDGVEVKNAAGASP